MDNIPVNTILPAQESTGDASSSGGPTETSSGGNPFIAESNPPLEKGPNSVEQQPASHSSPKTEVFEEKPYGADPLTKGPAKRAPVLDKTSEKTRLHPTVSSSDPVTTVAAEEEMDFIEHQEAAHDQSR